VLRHVSTIGAPAPGPNLTAHPATAALATGTRCAPFRESSPCRPRRAGPGHHGAPSAFDPVPCSDPRWRGDPGIRGGLRPVLRRRPGVPVSLRDRTAWRHHDQAIGKQRGEAVEHVVLVGGGAVQEDEQLLVPRGHCGILGPQHGIATDQHNTKPPSPEAWDFVLLQGGCARRVRLDSSSHGTPVPMAVIMVVTTGPARAWACGACWAARRVSRGVSDVGYASSQSRCGRPCG
jgi:hypothetical protein